MRHEINMNGMSLRYCTGQAFFNSLTAMIAKDPYFTGYKGKIFLRGMTSYRSLDLLTR